MQRLLRGLVVCGRFPQIFLFFLVQHPTAEAGWGTGAAFSKTSTQAEYVADTAAFRMPRRIEHGASGMGEMRGAQRADSLAWPNSLDSVSDRPASLAVDRPSGDSIATRDAVPERSANILGRLALPDTVHRMLQWNLDPHTWSYRPILVDSTLNICQFAHEGEPVRGTVRQLGIHYTPQLADGHFARIRMGRNMPFWMVAQAVHLHLPRRVFHTLGPFARFAAVSNGSTTVPDLGAGLWYTQNVTQHLNVGFDVMHGSERSLYKHLEGSLSKGQAFFSLSKGRWYISMWGGGGRHALMHNGGLTDDRFLTDTILREAETPVRLADAESTIRSQEYSADLAFDLVQRVRKEHDSLGNQLSTYREPRLSIISQQTYLHYSRLYRQTFPKTTPKNAPGGGHHHISSVATHDSVAFSLYEGRLGLSYRGHVSRNSWGVEDARAWVEYSTREYTMPVPHLYLTPDQQANRTHTITLGSHIAARWRDLDAGLGASWAMAGNERGSLRLSGLAQHRLADLFGGMYLRAGTTLVVQPWQPFARRYYSNSDAWDVLAGQPERELSMRVSAILPSIGGEYGAQAALYGGYLYFDTVARPAQYPQLNVVSLYAQQAFSYAGFLMQLRATYQISSQYAALALPRIVAYGMLGYEFAWSHRSIRLRLALDAYYHTAYRADVYHDALGVYHRQAKVAIGNYPMIGALLAMKWKSANVFIHLAHANEGLTGRNYFSGVHYPERERTVRLGFQWYFY